MDEEESLLYKKLCNKLGDLPHEQMFVISELYSRLKNIPSPFNIYYCDGNERNILSFKEFDILKNHIIYDFNRSYEFAEITTITCKCKLSYENKKWIWYQFRSEYGKFIWNILRSVDKVFNLYNSGTSITFPPTNTETKYAIELNTFIDFCRKQRKCIILIIASHRDRKNKKHWLPDELFNFIFKEFLF